MCVKSVKVGVGDLLGKGKIEEARMHELNYHITQSRTE